MKDKKNKNFKKIIFHGNYAYWPNEQGKRILAKNLAWQLIRFLLRGEPVDLLDGFVIFRSWREEKQEGEYLSQFQSQKSKAEKKFKDYNIEGLEIDHPKGDKNSWQLNGLESNITDAMRLAHNSCSEFRKGNPGGWPLIRQAYKEYQDAKSICQALIFADFLPKNCKPYEECLHGIKNLLENYTGILLQALFKVLCLASGKQQGITTDIAESAIERWLEEFLQVRQALLLISGHKFSKPKASTPDINIFFYLLQKYRECTDYVSHLKGKINQQQEVPDESVLNLAEEDAAKSLKQLISCNAVQEVCEYITGHYEQLSYYRITHSFVNHYRTAVMESFVRNNRTIGDSPDMVFNGFWVYFNRYISKVNKREGIVEVIKSDEKDEEKKKQFRLILVNMVDKDDGREKIKQLFDIVEHQFTKEFDITSLPCGGICPQPCFPQFQLMSEVLGIGLSKTPKWFRETGPIAADFADEMVYRRKELRNKLKDLVMKNPASLLLGEMATSKTVLVRDLAYQMHKDEDVNNIYYFSCHQPGGFDIGLLITKIKSIKGIVIIEDIHLCPQKAQQVYSLLHLWLEGDSNNHILFIGRSSFQEGQDKSLAEDLGKLPFLPLEPFQDVDAIIKHYIGYQAIHNPNLSWPAEAIEQIKTVSKQDYWLLAYALKGYVGAVGQGKPESWIKTGVTDYLNNLKNCGDLHANLYPQIVVLLSPLYINEVMTAEKYITDKLRFGQETLYALVIRGEITTYKTLQGYTLYGLPHSSLASAYWEHSKDYIETQKLKDYKEFIYDYAISDTPNGLKAVLNSIFGNIGYINELLSRLCEEGELGKLIEREQSFGQIFHLVVVELWPPFLLNDNILESLVRKIETANDADKWLHLIDTIFNRCDDGWSWGISKRDAHKIWKFFDKEKLAVTLSCVHETGLFFHCMYLILEYDVSFAYEIMRTLRMRELAERLGKDNCSHGKDLYLTKIIRTNPSFGHAFLELLKRHGLPCNDSDGNVPIL